MATHCLKRSLKFFAGCIILIAASISANSQTNPAIGNSPWGWANPTPHGYIMTDMSFIDNNTGLAVGNAGGLARSTDGGRNWKSIPFKYVNTVANTVTVASFADVQFVTPNVAYAVGATGLMIKSTDGGLTWTKITTPLTPFNKNINALYFLNKDTGYIGGQSITSGNTTSINDAPKVYFTRNGGITWDSLATPFRPQQLNLTLSTFNQSEIHRIHFVNDSVGYVSGSCANVVATNSAILWKIDKHVVKDYSIHRSKFGNSATTGPYTPGTQTYKGVLGVNDSLVLISSLNNNVVIRVKTGKNDSTASAYPTAYGAYERGIYEIVVWVNSVTPGFPAPLVNNVAGQMAHIRKTSDGKILINCGNSLIISPDNGTSWSFTRPTPPTLSYAHWGFNALDVTANGRIVMASFNGMTYDSIQGSPWSTVYNVARPLFNSYGDMDWADYCNGIVVGSNGTFVKTSDGGKTWVPNINPIFDGAGIGIVNVIYHAVNNMVFSTPTSIFRSPNQGTTISVMFTEPNANGQLNNLTMVGTDRAFAVGYRFSPNFERTMIFRSLNANSATPVWDTVKTFPTGNFAPQLRNIKFANQDTGYTVGNRGKVYRTINGGNTWTDVSPDSTAAGNLTTTFTGLSIVNGKTLYISGSSRKFFRSTDAGATWTDLTLPVPTPPHPVSSFTTLTNIIMNDANNGYIQAANILLRTTDAWATYTYDLAPTAMSFISLYPKNAQPLDNKKVYAGTVTAGFPGPTSTQAAYLLEYGNTALTTVNSTELIASASCSNPNGGSITVTAAGGLAPYTYSINGGPFQSSNVFTGLTAGPKTINIKDAACQNVAKTITVPFNDDLVLSANNDETICANAPYQLTATGNGASYSWSPATGLSNPNIANPVATITSNTTYTVTATLNGCVKTEPVVLTVKPSPIISAGPDKTIVVGDQVVLQGSANDPVTITWTPNSTLQYSTTLTPVASPVVTTPYTLTVRNSQNCTSTDIVLVTVLPDCAKPMNAFTPNGDGMNDKWLVIGGTDCTKKVAVAVYNRYGNVVYKNGDYKQDWDGTYNGKPVADGTYYYVVTYTTITDKIVVMNGDVTILR